MKKFLFSVLTAAFTFTSLSAQTYTVYMVGSPGYNFKMAQDDTITPGELPLDLSVTGAGQIWDFDQLDADNEDTLYFQTPNATELTEFPAGNLVMESNIGRIIFEKDPLSGLYLHGTALSMGGFDLSLNYSPAQRILLPNNTLGTIDSTVSTINEKIYVGIDTTIGGTCQVVIDSIWVKRQSKFKFHFDAAGELRLPATTYPNTLRCVALEHTIDTIYIYCPNGIDIGTCFVMSAPIGWSIAPDFLIQLSGFGEGGIAQDSTQTASWYTADASSPICVVTYETAYDNSDTTFFNVRYASTANADIGFEEYSLIDLQTYPNPASNVILLQTSAEIGDATLYIYNSIGQQVRTVNLNGSNAVDVSTMSNGMYFYQLANGKKLLHHGKFMVKR